MRPFVLATVSLVIAAVAAAQPLTPEQAYKQGCGTCHSNERAVLRDIPRLPDPARREWIESFMAIHPCERDTLKPAIVDYLMERTRR